MGSVPQYGPESAGRLQTILSLSAALPVDLGVSSMGIHGEWKMRVKRMEWSILKDAIAGWLAA